MCGAQEYLCVRRSYRVPADLAAAGGQVCLPLGTPLRRSGSEVRAEAGAQK